MLLAAEDGITVADLGYRRDRSMAIALSPRLAHDTGANGIFTALAAAARASGGRQALECWWGERRCAAAWGESARPDGYGRWPEQAPGQPPAVADFFLEYDTGTEPLRRVIAKLAGYAALAARTGITTPVLFWLREPEPGGRAARPAGRPAAARHPRRRLGRADPRRPRRDRRPPALSPGGPAGAAWLPAASPGPRLRLAQLAPPGTAPAGGGPDGEAPGGPPGGLPWHPPDPAPPAWNALPGEPRPGQAGDD